MFARMMWNEYYRYYLQQLQAMYSPDEATAITMLVFENKAGITRKDIIAFPDKTFNTEQKAALDKALQQLLTNKPAQQVTGEAWFYNLQFAINENVLIPRPETEELIQWILDENKGQISMLDIGSGSGCIPVALKKNLPGAVVTSIDVSNQALLIAKKNAAFNNANIDFLQVDFLNTNEWQQLSSFDIIVSNPPYIPLQEKDRLDSTVSRYEPGLALFVPDNKPLIFYEAIADFAKTHLKKDGKIYVEIHQDFARETVTVFSNVFRDVEIRKDINGNERMIKATHFL